MPHDDRLTRDFDAHVPFSFASIPESPPLANRAARVKRWFFIAFAESWLAVFLFRLKQRLRAAGVPALPTLCDLISRALFRISIGNAVEIGPGLMMTHGNVVIDGRTRIGRHCQINPWVTIGLSNSRRYGFSAEGPTIGDEVHIGTGAKILGPVHVGDYARIGANAVVIDDVPANTTVVGIPARPISQPARTGPSSEDSNVASVRQAILDYKLRRRSLQSLVDELTASLSAPAGKLREARQQCEQDLAFLGAIAVAGGDDSPEVRRSLDAVEAALA